MDSKHPEAQAGNSCDIDSADRHPDGQPDRHPDRRADRHPDRRTDRHPDCPDYTTAYLLAHANGARTDAQREEYLNAAEKAHAARHKTHSQAQNDQTFDTLFTMPA